MIPAVTRYDLERARLAAAPGAVPPDAPGTKQVRPGNRRRLGRRIGTGLLVGVAATAAIFAGSLAAVTVVETVKGSPLSGGDSGGLSVLGGSGSDTDPGTIPTTATHHHRGVDGDANGDLPGGDQRCHRADRRPRRNDARPATTSTPTSSSAPDDRIIGEQLVRAARQDDATDGAPPQRCGDRQLDPRWTAA